MALWQQESTGFSRGVDVKCGELEKEKARLTWSRDGPGLGAVNVGNTDITRSGEPHSQFVRYLLMGA